MAAFDIPDGFELVDDTASPQAGPQKPAFSLPEGFELADDAPAPVKATASPPLPPRRPAEFQPLAPDVAPMRSEATELAKRAAVSASAPAVQPLDDAPFRSGGTALDAMPGIGPAGGMMTGAQAFDEATHDRRAIDTRSAIVNERARRAQQIVNEGLGDQRPEIVRQLMAQGLTEAEANAEADTMDAATRGSARQAARDAISEQNELSDQARGIRAGTQTGWRSALESVPRTIANQALQTGAGIARIATSPIAVMQALTGDKSPSIGDFITRDFQAAQDRVGRVFNPDRSRDEELGQKVVNGLASTAAFVIGGKGLSGLGASGAKGTAIAGALPEAESMWREVEKAEQLNPAYGGELKKWTAFLLGLPIGATEALPIEHGLRIGGQSLVDAAKRLREMDTVTTGGVTRAIGRVLGGMSVSAGEEGVQEALQAFLENLLVRRMTLGDPNTPLTKDVAENALVGALSGAVMAGGGGSMAVARDAMSGRLSADQRIPLPPEVPPVAEALPQPSTPAQSPAEAEGAERPPIEGPATPQSEPPVSEAPAPSAQAAPASPVSTATPTQPERKRRKKSAPTQDEAALLASAGYDQQSIDDMNASERAEAIEEARAAGVEPLTATSAGAETTVQSTETQESPSQVNPTPGTRRAPIVAETTEDMSAAGAVVNAAPTDAQKEAGNYQKAHARVGGFDVSIENPAGSTRSGKAPDGSTWSTQMPAHYGYIKGTKGRDNDHVDTYVGANPQSAKAFIVDQMTPETGRFDEHKVMLGFDSLREAQDAYERGFSDGSGASRMGDISEVSTDELRAWLDREGRRVQPFSGLARGMHQMAGQPQAKASETTFKTAKGSTYTLHEDGTTTRVKAARAEPGHEGDEGPKDRSARTVFLTPRAANALEIPQGASWRFVDHGNGTFSLATHNSDGKWGIAPGARNIPVKDRPTVGAIPLELWNSEGVNGRTGYRQAHFGNRVSEIGKSPEVVQPQPIEVPEGFELVDEPAAPALETRPPADQVAQKQVNDLLRSKDFKKARDAYNEGKSGSKRWNTPHHESEVAHTFAQGFYDQKAGRPIDESEFKPSTSVQEYGFNPINSYASGWKFARDGVLVEYRASQNAVLVEGLQDTGETVEPSATADRQPARAIAARVKQPPSLLQFLRSIGLKPDPELTALGLHRARPGIIRKSGKTLDMAREAAVEAGYLQDRGGEHRPSDSTPRDLLDAIEQELRGRKVYSQQDNVVPDDAPAADRQHEIARQDVRADLHDAGLTDADINDAYLDRAAELMVNGEASLADAYERAVLEDAKVSDDIQSTPELDEIPFEGSDAEAHAGTEAQGGEGSPQVSGKEPGRGASEADAAGREGDDRTRRPGREERQGVIPGAEEISQGALAQRRADRPLTPKVDQQRDTGGLPLFGDQRNQDDLFDAPKKAGKDGDKRASIASRAKSVGADPIVMDRAQAVRTVAEIVQRVAGPSVGVEVWDKLYASGPMLRASGADSEERTEVNGLYNAIENIISIALDSGDPFTTTHHEAFHALQNMGVITAQEKAILDRERPQLEEMVAREYGLEIERAREMPDYEIDAYAYGLYAQAREADSYGPSGMHIAVRRVMEKIRQLFEAIRNVLGGLGFQTYRGVFERARTGELQRRGGEEGGGDGVRYSVLRRSPTALGFVAPLAEANERAGMAQTAPRPARPGTFQMPAESRFTDWTRAVQERFIDLRRAQEAITDHTGAPLHQSLDAMLAQELFPGRSSERLEDFRNDVVKPLVAEMKELAVTPAEIDQYLYARHAPERNALMAQRDPQRFGADGGSGMANAAATEIMQNFRAAGRLPALEAIAARADAIIAADRDNRLNAGLISDEQLDQWESAFKFYTPLRGFGEQEDETNAARAKPLTRPHIGSGFDLRGREAKNALGRRSIAASPLANIILQHEEGIVRAEKNRVARTILRLVKAHPNPDLWEVDRVATKRVLDETSGLVKVVADPLAALAPNVLTAKVGGESYRITLHHPGMATAVKNLGAADMGMLTRAASKFTRLFSSLQTSRNPAFFIANAIRDVQEAGWSVWAERDITKAKLLGAYLKAWPQAFAASAKLAMGGKASERWGNLAEEWRKHGGKISYNSLRDLESVASDISAELRRTMPRGKRIAAGVREEGIVTYPVKSLMRTGFIRFIEATNDVFESATRLAVYAAAREEGRYTPERAASLAREATVNFNRRGNMGATVNAWYAFANAGIQGIGKNTRLLKNSKRFAIGFASLAPLGFFGTLLARAAAGDDDEEKGRSLFDNIPQWERDSSIIIPYGRTKPQSGGKAELRYLKIPLAFQSKLPWALGQNLAMMLVGAQKPPKAGANMLSALIDSYNPVGHGSFLNMLAPTIADPIVDVTTNKDWRDRDIVPPKQSWNEGLARSSQHTRNEHPAYVGVAQALNRWTGGDRYKSGLMDIHPGHLRYGAEWATGGLGRFIAGGTNALLGWAQGRDVPISEIPIARSFVGQTTPAAESARYYEQQREERGRDNRLRKAKRDLRDDPANADALATVSRESEALGIRNAGAKRPEREGSIGRMFERTNKAIGGLRDQADDVKRDRSITAADRDAKLKRIEAQIESLMREARKNRRAVPAAP